MGRVNLIGGGWKGWSGAWHGALELAGTEHGWVLSEMGQPLGAWTGFADAVAALWSGRRRRDRRPWAVGWLSYEECAHLARLPHREPDASVLRGWWLIEPEPERRSRQDVPGARRPGGIRTSLGDREFEAAVGAILEHIAAGDVYQVNLTRRFTMPGWRGSMTEALAIAAAGSPPPYLARISCESHELVCASMELLVRRRGRHVETRPIKGTRPRGANQAHDRALVDELDTDPKERAELAMVVDLERNDLGRVAEIGSVRVPDPGKVYTYPTLHHRIARVTAEVDPEVPWWELVAATVPGGSVTGCPKHAAMRLISKLEPVARGPYTGILGVIFGNGDLELALPIRTAWRVGDRLEFAAGCGIVWGSRPEAEQQESRLKVAAWLGFADR